MSTATVNEASPASPDASVINERITDTSSRLGVAKAVQQLQYLESQLDLFDRLVDMSDIYKFGDEGNSGVTAATGSMQQGITRARQYPGAHACAFINEVEHRDIRAASRAFALINPFAIGAQENRINYTVGTGHTYTVTAKDPDDEEIDDDVLHVVHGIIDEFCDVNEWGERQAETIRRLDRDGERLLRLFPNFAVGLLSVRFTEPIQLRTPIDKASDPDVWFGIKFAPGDYETPIEYYVHSTTMGGSADGNYEIVPAAQMQHIKWNVDMTAPRGLPTWYATSPFLQSAVRTLRNMGSLVEFRSKIGMIRKHVAQAKATVQQVVTANAAATGTGENGVPRSLLAYPPAAIIDAPQTTEYEFPSFQTEVEKIVAGIQADLRAAASALGIPEYMISGDASNANYASTMVAEGPAVKGFERLQDRIIEKDRKIILLAIAVAAEAKGLPEDICDRIKIDAEPPQLKTENRFQNTQSDAILVDRGIMSSETMAARHSLDYHDEFEKIEADQERKTGYAGMGASLAQADANAASFKIAGVAAGDKEIPSLPGGPGDASQLGGSAGGQPAKPGSGAESPDASGGPQGQQGNAGAGVDAGTDTGLQAIASTGDIQGSGLNGAQIQQLLAIVDLVTSGSMEADTAKELILLAFPLLPAERVEALVKGLKVKEEPEPPQLPPGMPGANPPPVPGQVPPQLAGAAAAAKAAAGSNAEPPAAKPAKKAKQKAPSTPPAKAGSDKQAEESQQVVEAHDARHAMTGKYSTALDSCSSTAERATADANAAGMAAHFDSNPTTLAASAKAHRIAADAHLQAAGAHSEAGDTAKASKHQYEADKHKSIADFHEKKAGLLGLSKPEVTPENPGTSGA